MSSEALPTLPAYLDGGIVFEADPAADVFNLTEVFKQLRKYNLKFSPSKAKNDPTYAHFLGHTISPAGIYLVPQPWYHYVSHCVGRCVLFETASCSIDH